MQFDKLADILDFAIAKEQEAADFYTGLAGKVKDATVSEELMKMATMEEAHRDWLKESNTKLATSGAVIPAENLKIADFTVEPEPTADMAWQDIINLAMHREANAMSLYNNLAKIVTDASAKQVFENLAAEESRHKLYFEREWDDEVLQEN